MENKRRLPNIGYFEIKYEGSDRFNSKRTFSEKGFIALTNAIIVFLGQHLYQQSEETKIGPKFMRVSIRVGFSPEGEIPNMDNLVSIIDGEK